MTAICEGLRAMGVKLNLLGLDKAPAKSTAWFYEKKSHFFTRSAGE